MLPNEMEFMPFKPNVEPVYAEPVRATAPAQRAEQPPEQSNPVQAPVPQETDDQMEFGAVYDSLKWGLVCCIGCAGAPRER